MLRIIAREKKNINKKNNEIKGAAMLNVTVWNGPYTNGTYLWAEFDDLSKWEKKLMKWNRGKKDTYNYFICKSIGS